MIFGDIKQFAIEFEINEICGKLLYGNLRMWVGGVSIGDYGEASDIAASVRWAQTFLNHSMNRSWPEVPFDDPQKVFREMYGKYLLPTGSSVIEYPPSNWDGFALTLDDIGESSTLDKFGILVLRDSERNDHVLAMDLETREITLGLLPDGALDVIIRAYVNWVAAKFDFVFKNFEHS